MKSRYQLIRQIGEGGMGRVYLAEDTTEGRQVALKFLPTDFGIPVYERFREEVSLLSHLSHPNLIRIFDYHEDWEGSDNLTKNDALTGPLYSMEYVDGLPIDQATKGLNVEDVLDVFVQFCRGLHYLHSHNVLHRDLKPQNALLAPNRILKILDFGLSGSLRPGEREKAMGTWTYMAPEARAGLYDTQSDLYSMGVVFQEVLKGRKDLPRYFSDLLDRLCTPDPTKRPHSALSLIKFLNRHVDRPYDLRDEMETATVLTKVPWVPRPEEKKLARLVSDWRAKGKTQILSISGPTGVGRTRLIEELKWRLQLEGVGFERVLPGDFDGWQPPAAPTVVHLPDLHEWSAAGFEPLTIALRRYERQGLKSLFLLDFDSDLLPTGVENLTSDEVRLSDLDAATTRRLVRQATLDLDKTIPEATIEAIVTGSGGRPLLVLEQLRSYLIDPSRPFEATKDLAHTASLLVASLPPKSRNLFARVVIHPEPVGLWDFSGSWETMTDLVTRDLVVPSPTHPGAFALAHPAMRFSYEASFSPSDLQEAHRDWLNILQEKHGAAPKNDAFAPSIALHALGAGEEDTAYTWGLAAMDYHLKSGSFVEALSLTDRLLARAKDTVPLYTLHAHQAPIYYRLGRYLDALKSYDQWYALKPDDGTGVETIKHRLYTGLVLSTAGKTDEARRRLQECLTMGDDTAHAHHRGYHARARILLAGIEEREEHRAEARRLLEEALPLAQGQPLFLGEIEEKLGALAAADNRLEEADRRLIASRDWFCQAGNPQAEAIPTNSQSVLHRHRGALGLALSTANEAVALSEKGGERLQTARFRQTRALVLMDLGRYGQALAEMEEIGDIFAIIGDPEDRRLAACHRAEIYRLLGNPERGERILKESGLSPDDIPHQESEAATAVMKLLQETHGRDFSEPDLAHLSDAVYALEAPEARVRLFTMLSEELGRRGLDALGHLFQQAALNELHIIHKELPEELKMDFEKQRDVKSLDQSLGNLFKTQPQQQARAIPETRFRQFCEINRKIAMKPELKGILEEVLDAGVEISGAERGFVLLKNEKSKSPPLPGFEVKAARNLNQKSLQEGEFELSLTMVKQAIDKKSYVITDDAFSDPRFHETKSVMEYHLRSILVLPLESEGSIFGAIYLDHRFQPDCFSEENLMLLRALASQASLAIQKTRLIEELTAAKNKLAGQVEEQKEQIEVLSEQLANKRSDLRYGYEEIIGQSAGMMKVFQLLDHVTETTIPVWIHGESGTGKELIARSLHYNSPRKNGPFVAENVSAIPETLLESELFGHKKGSFTHADRDRVGLFEQANGGTLFLDELADMSLAMQAKLLRVLQEGEIRPVGTSKSVKINVRLVTASNRNLEQLVREGKFRQDLFFRINGLAINLPPLRERRDDIPLLVRYLIKKISKEFNLPSAEINDRALQSLLKHGWPGNIRELEGALRNALLFAKGRPITPEFLTMAAASPSSTTGTGASKASQAGGEEDAEERQMIVNALRKHQLDKVAAAKDLGTSLRTLYTRLDQLGIPKKKTLLARYVGVA